MKKSMLFLLSLIMVIPLFGAYFKDLETEIVQPDGETFHLLASGDEYYNWLHDEDNFTIIQSQKDGYFYYAEQDRDNLKPSRYRVGEVNPNSIGLEKGLHISSELYKSKVQQFHSNDRNDIKARTSGTLNNLVVYIKFSDQEEFEEPRQFFDDRFNGFGNEDISVKEYYDEVSYGQLEMASSHYPICEMDVSLSYQDDHPRSYYMPYNATTNPDGYEDWERTDREHSLLANAINSISDQIPDTLDIDFNDDGYVDNVCFVVRGVHTAWSDLLWAHRWSLWSQDAYIGDKMVMAYTFQPENQNTVRTICHELFHALGAPDLYHYDFDGISPAGPWDIMESGFVHMGAYMKYIYGGWIDEIPEITTAGTYSLNPLTSGENNCYKIVSPTAWNQYFVLEYRKKDLETADRNVPGSGLLVYRVNGGMEGEGNAQGPPDELYLYREDGTLEENGFIANAFYSEESGRTAINNYSNPAAFLVNGDGGNLNIKNIGTAGDQISFEVSFVEDDVPPSVEITFPSNGAFLPSDPLVIESEISDPLGSVDHVNFYLDGEMLGSDNSEPYEVDWDASASNAGSHVITVEATNLFGLVGTKEIEVTVLQDGMSHDLNWFTNEPVYNEFGRGSIPIKAAVEFDLGDAEYTVNSVSVNIVQDPFGQNDVPGWVNCTINRMEGTEITDEELLDVGSFISPMDGRYTHEVSNTAIITGKVALIMDLGIYQNIKFDIYGTNCHSWLTEPDRPWVDAISRGMIGAADIGMNVTPVNTNTIGNEVIPNNLTLNHYPNPFQLSANTRSSGSNIFFEITKDQQIELNVFNIKGQKVSTVDKGYYKAGKHTLNWNGLDKEKKQVASGIYFYKLKTNEKEKISKILVIQ